MVKVYDRRKKEFIEEKDSPWINIALNLGIKIPPTLHSLVSGKITQKCKEDFEKKDRKLIKDFVKMYDINTQEAEHPLIYYSTLQEFFQRKRKNIRISSINNPKVFVSPSDCRILVYPHLSIGKSIWVKGNEFTIDKLLGSKTNLYKGCSLVICRLAPQDYHRFHFPVSGYYTRTKNIKGHYYSVKPSVVNSSLDVFTENRRTVTYLKTKYFSKVAIVAIGATCVGSIVITARSNSYVKKGQEYGTFAFGGSTIILLVPRGLITFDKELLEYSKKGIESLVRVGDKIGYY